MSTYIDRMHDEVKELDGKIERGADYLAKHPLDRLLAAQLAVMRAYSEILSERIDDAKLQAAA